LFLRNKHRKIIHDDYEVTIIKDRQTYSICAKGKYSMSLTSVDCNKEIVIQKGHCDNGNQITNNNVLLIFSSCVIFGQVDNKLITIGNKFYCIGCQQNRRVNNRLIIIGNEFYCIGC
jgi:hypothetical protein